MLRGYNDIISWPWKGVKKDKQLVMDHDGVHLSERNGMFKYYKSVRGALVQAPIFVNMGQNIMPDRFRLYTMYIL